MVDKQEELNDLKDAQARDKRSKIIHSQIINPEKYSVKRKRFAKMSATKKRLHYQANIAQFLHEKGFKEKTIGEILCKSIASVSRYISKRYEI